MSKITIRRATPADAPRVAQIIFDAFGTFQDRHRFPRDFPVLDAAVGFANAWLNHPKVYPILAEVDGRAVGFNALDERDEIGSPGPVVVDPNAQAKGVGRRMMEVVIDRAAKMRGMRLMQEAYNTCSMSLYASLGFDVKEPIALMRGKLEGSPTVAGLRPMSETDLPACAKLCERVHGLHRSNELSDALQKLGPVVMERDGRIVAYSSSPGFALLNHVVAETTDDMQALVRAISAERGEAALFVPTRNASFFRWCLAQGLRVEKPFTLMSRGEYQEPRGAFCPSVEY